ncbi:unnamed protein product, partial [Owenia fusiformis]
EKVKMGSGNKEKDMLNILVNNLYITALFVALLCTQCTSEECVKVSDCSCRTSKGQIELTDQIYSVDAQDKARYKYSPCKTFSDPTGSTSECKDVAACQEVSSPEIPPTITYYKVGDLKTAKFQGEPGQNLEVQYTGSGTRQTFVTLVCGTGDDEFKGKGEDPLGSAKYYFTLTTKAACYPQQGTPSGLSPGSVMLILSSNNKIQS